MTHTQGQFYPRMFALVATALLGYAVLGILQPFVGPILWAALLAFLLFPANQRLRGALRGRQGAAAILLTLAGMLVIVIPAVLITILFVQQASDLVGWLHVQGGPGLPRMSEPLRIPIIDRAIQFVTTVTPITVEEVHGWAIEGGKRLLQTLASFGGSVFAGALGAVLGLFLMLFILSFFLRDGEIVLDRILCFVPMEDGRKAHLVEHLSPVTKAVVLGALMIALVQGALIGIGVAIVRLPSSIVCADLASGAALVPLIGSALVWAPAALVLTAQGHEGSAIFLVIWGVAVVSSVDNFLRPRFISGRAQISTLPVLIGLLGGLHAFGPIGMFLGPVAVASVLALFRFAGEAREKSASI